MAYMACWCRLGTTFRWARLWHTLILSYLGMSLPTLTKPKKRSPKRSPRKWDWNRFTVFFFFFARNRSYVLHNCSVTYQMTIIAQVGPHQYSILPQTLKSSVFFHPFANTQGPHFTSWQYSSSILTTTRGLFLSVQHLTWTVMAVSIMSGSSTKTIIHWMESDTCNFNLRISLVSPPHFLLGPG